MNLAMWLYRLLARAFPHEFKVVYGADVIQLGEDIVEDIARRNGIGGLARMIGDLLVRVPMEYLSELRRDLIYALRMLAKSRGFAAVGIISLGLGIGITAVGVSETLNLLLRDAPGARDPDQLITFQGVSYPYIEHYRDHHDLFAGVAAYQLAIPFNIAIGEAGSVKAERVFGQLVSPEYFSVVGANAARGRVFSPDVDKPGSPPLVFITDRFWRERLNSDPNVVGRTIRVNGQTATIVGVGPKDFHGVMPFIPADIFVPTTAPDSMVPELAGDAIHKQDTKTFSALFRLAPGVTSQSAEAGLDAITRQLDQETLDPARNAKGRRILVMPGGKIIPLPRSLLPLAFAFMFMLNGMIVGLACMNLANMQLARAMARRKEVAIRLSVGASRFRLIRQLLTESVLLAWTGGIAGILLSYWMANFVRHAKLPFPFPVEFDLTPDWRVIVVVFGISLIAGVGFGLAPALAATKTDLSSTLKEGAAGQARGYRRFGLRNLLMVGQVAGALALLLLAGFMVLGFSITNRMEVAFDPATMYLMSIDPIRDGYTAEKTANLFDNLAERLKRAPGVREVALAESAPFTPLAAVATVSAPASGSGPDQIVSGTAQVMIGPNYFAALSVAMLEGREFEMRDQRLEESKGKVLPLVINQAAAHALFGASDPIGRRVLNGSKSYEVIGVVKNLSAPMSATAVGQTAGSDVPVIYTPITRTEFAHPSGVGMIVMIRSDRATDAMEGVRKELASIDPNLAVFNVQSLSAQIENTVAYLRFSEFIYGGIGVFGLVLAAIGLAGVTAYSVARRRKEIGIRMALGARKGQVLRLVMREGGWLVLIGSVLGLLAASGFARALAAFSSVMGPAFTAGTRDPRLLIGAPLLLAALAMFACYLPARRSTRIDPLTALREE
jgi:predicted permease